jgi:hypothetical protein
MMVDGSGFADGFDMPGDVTANSPIVDYTEAVYPLAGIGFTDGTGFEVRVPWCDLITSCVCESPDEPPGSGTPNPLWPGSCTPQAIFFHVSSSNTTNIPSGVTDNLGNPDGTIGYFGFFSVDISPDNTSTIGSTGATAQVVTYTHTITNEMPSDQIINMYLTSTSGFDYITRIIRRIVCIKRIHIEPYTVE